MDADTLAGRLAEPGGWASVLRGMFRYGRAEQAHAIYSAARDKGVYVNHELRFVTHESVGYAVMAFRTTAPLDQSTRETLAAQAERFKPGTVRRESVAYGTLLPLTGSHPIRAIATPFSGVIVYVAATSPKGADRPLVVHADREGVHHIYPVPGAVLEETPR